MCKWPWCKTATVLNIFFNFVLSISMSFYFSSNALLTAVGNSVYLLDTEYVIALFILTQL